MDTSEYQQKAVATIQTSTPDATQQSCIFGLTREAGNIAELFQQHVVTPTMPLDTKSIVNALGDMVWYVTVLAEQSGSSLNQLLEQNAAKIAAKFPEATSAHSTGRQPQHAGQGQSKSQRSGN